MYMTPNDSERARDVVIIGTGAAELTASACLARAANPRFCSYGAGASGMLLNASLSGAKQPANGILAWKDNVKEGIHRGA